MKDLPPPHDMVDAIGNAYERMLERAIENTKKITNAALPRLIAKSTTI